MESNLIHFIDELKRINSVLESPKNSNQVIGQLKHKRNQIIGKIDQLHIVQGLVEINYFQGEKFLGKILVKANTEYEKQFFAQALGEKNKIKYTTYSFREISTGLFSKHKVAF